MPMVSFGGRFVLLALSFSGNAVGLGGAMRIVRLPNIATTTTRRIGSRIRLPSRNICLSAAWWDGENNDNDTLANFFGTNESETKPRDEQKYSPSLITQEMEDEVMASARATMDTNTVSRAISSLIQDESDVNFNKKKTAFNVSTKKGKNRLRDLVTSNYDLQIIGSSTVGNSNRDGFNSESTSWDTQQIAIASGATTFLLSPLVIPIIHSILPPIIPFPSSISLTGAALLGTIAYIVALGDTTEQSNPISGTTGGVLGDGVEVGGAVSRILGRTALQSVQTSAPRLKAAARALVDYDRNTASLEELRRVQDQLLQSLTELEMENDTLRRELALWQVVEDVSNMYKLEELKEIARYHGLKGYSTDGKNSLLRRLAKEGILKLDLSRMS